MITCWEGAILLALTCEFNFLYLMLLPYSTHLVHYAVIFFTHGTCQLTKMYIPQGIALEFNKNVQGGVTGNTTPYYQNITKGFEFLDANIKIKAV